MKRPTGPETQKEKTLFEKLRQERKYAIWGYDRYSRTIQIEVTTIDENVALLELSELIRNYELGTIRGVGGESWNYEIIVSKLFDFDEVLEALRKYFDANASST